MKYRLVTLLLILAVAGIAYFDYSSEVKKNSVLSKFPFKLGLDLAGGTQLTYKADVSNIDPGSVSDQMDTLRDVIERRVNRFGVTEPIVQVESAGIISGNATNRLIVELPGVTDIDKAIAFVGQTPTLEFMLQKDNAQDILKKNASSTVADLFTSTGLTGRYLDKASLEFDQTFGKPGISLVFNSEGADLFAKITKENVGKTLSIFLDGAPISSPTIREEIKDGKAQITGNFTVDEAKSLVNNLQYGALPVPINLISSETIGASLGTKALNSGVKAGIIGFLAVIIFLIVWYRLPGLVASIALVMYVIISLAIFKLIPVTLTAAGLAGFILSVGMAVDANVLIFERLKEELKKGKDLEDSLNEGFHRAWTSIRDSNISSIITSIVLFWLGTSSIKGFALTLFIGVVISMFTAITASRSMLFALKWKGFEKVKKIIFGNGFLIR